MYYSNGDQLTRREKDVGQKVDTFFEQESRKNTQHGRKRKTGRSSNLVDGVHRWWQVWFRNANIWLQLVSTAVQLLLRSMRRSLAIWHEWYSKWELPRSRNPEAAPCSSSPFQKYFWRTVTKKNPIHFTQLLEPSVQLLRVHISKKQGWKAELKADTSTHKGNGAFQGKHHCCAKHLPSIAFFRVHLFSPPPSDPDGSEETWDST